MERLEGAVTSDGTAELEVIECDCGYHMGIDASFVTHVDHAFFDIETRCPACGEEIPVRELLEMEPIEVSVPVCRISYAHRDIKVTANSLYGAMLAAEDDAGNHEFAEKEADYEADDGWHMK